MEGSVGVQPLAGMRRVPSITIDGASIDLIDPSSRLKLEAKNFPSEILSTEIKDTCLGRALPGFDLKRAELQVQLCPFLPV